MKKFLCIGYFSFCTFLLISQNVGINTTMPGAKLHVNGDIKITDGSQGTGEVLTSNADGLASWQPPKTVFALASSSAVATNDYVGLGSSGSSFIRNTIVVPFNCEITSLTFSLRKMALITYTCTIWVSPGNGNPPVSTGIQATVNVGNYFAISSIGAYPLIAGDLLSVRISSGTTDGIAASIIVNGL